MLAHREMWLIKEPSKTQPTRGFTVAANDWCVVYVETFQEFKDALSREKQIKAWKSRIMIEKLINVSGHGSAHPDL
ncbi:MAG: hypothetical protein M9948_03625 [Lentimicrobium sp.]|nr:hypothetical protein [Lentimicrobium sp.]